MKSKAEHGDRVRLQYRRLFDDQATAAVPHYRRVLEFIVGSPEVISGISLGVVGMAKGDRKQLTLQPQEAFGDVRPKLIREISRERFPIHLKLCAGQRLTAVGVNSGRRRRVRVVNVGPKSVTVDSNHRLAGKTLKMEVRLVSLDSLSHPRSKPAQDLG